MTGIGRKVIIRTVHRKADGTVVEENEFEVDINGDD